MYFSTWSKSLCDLPTQTQCCVDGKGRGKRGLQNWRDLPIATQLPRARHEANKGVWQQAVCTEPFYPAKNAGLGDERMASSFVLAQWMPTKEPSHWLLHAPFQWGKWGTFQGRERFQTRTEKFLESSWPRKKMQSLELGNQDPTLQPKCSVGRINCEDLMRPMHESTWSTEDTE